MKGWQWAFVFIIRILVILYCLQICAVMVLAMNDLRFKQGLHIQHELVSLIVFGLMGLINLKALIQLCCCNRKKIFDPNKRCQREKQGKYRQRLNQLLESDWLIVVAEMVEIPLQSIQCYLIHEHTVSQTYALLFTIILILNCWMIANPKTSIKQCMLIDVVLDLTYVLLPLTVLGLPLLFEYLNDLNLYSKFEFSTLGMNVGRSMTITSAMDLCTKAFPILFSSMRMWTLTKRWQNVITKRKKTSIEHHPLFQWFRRFMFLWGWIILGISIHAHSGTRCDRSTCLYQSHPWFTERTTCVCKVRLYSCRPPFSTQFYDLKELEHDEDLTHLKIDGCSDIQTLPSKAINKMVKMETMEFVFLNLSKFEVEISNMPRLLVLKLNSNPLGDVPPVLYHHKLPPLLVNLQLSNTSISLLPEQALTQWKEQLVALYLDHNPLQTFPMSLLKFEHLHLLLLSRTGITTLPSNFTSLKNLIHFEMSSCALETLPNLNQMPQLRGFNLANNSLTQPPLLQHPELFYTIEWSLNPFCNLEEYSSTRSCAPQCSPDCSSIAMKQYSCDPICSSSNCNHPSCS